MRPFSHFAVSCRLKRRGLDHLAFSAATCNSLFTACPSPDSAHPPTLAVELALEGNEATGGGGRGGNRQAGKFKEEATEELEEQMDE